MQVMGKRKDDRYLTSISLSAAVSALHVDRHDPARQEKTEVT